MERIHRSSDKGFAEITHAAIAIQSAGENQRHTGILYTDPESSEVKLLHLAWHFDLRLQSPSDKYLWVDPLINPNRLRQVSAICRMILRANPQGIPYAFSLPHDAFDSETGRFLIGPTRLGLTCATFVLAVFEAAGLRLIKFDGWPSREPEDSNWQNDILYKLSTADPVPDPEHIEGVRNEIGACRFRPEDVAGASICKPLPADFDATSEKAQLILTALTKHN